jgi:hypothetical protein
MLQETTNRKYLTVGYGRIRSKCDATNSKAVERVTKKGEKTYAIEYQSITAQLEKIYYKESLEYGNAWAVQLKDGVDLYSLQISEQSRECGDLLKRIPNLVYGQVYKFTPFDFQAEKGRKRGLSIKNIGDESIENYYQNFEKLPDGKWKITNLYGFPEYTGDPKDRDELKLHYATVNVFLKKSALKFLNTQQPIESATPGHEHENIVDDDIPMPVDDGAEDGLPF